MRAVEPSFERGESGLLAMRAVEPSFAYASIAVIDSGFRQTRKLVPLQWKRGRLTNKCALGMALASATRPATASIRVRRAEEGVKVVCGHDGEGTLECLDTCTCLRQPCMRCGVFNNMCLCGITRCLRRQ